MEFVSGGALFDRIVDNGRYSERDACKSFLEICRGLKYLHERGIAHRDLKVLTVTSLCRLGGRWGWGVGGKGAASSSAAPALDRPT